MTKLALHARLSTIIKGAAPVALRRVYPKTFDFNETSAVRCFATIGAEGSDSDFAPKKSAPVANKNRDVTAEIKQVLISFVAPVL